MLRCNLISLFWFLVYFVNMLSNIKEKLLKSVPLFNHENKSNSKPDQCLNPYAGAEIVTKYEQEWETLHKNNLSNVNAAEKLAEHIQTIANKVEHDKNNIETIVHLNTDLKQPIKNCLTQIKSLYETCETIEGCLVDLEDIVEQVEFQNKKKLHRFHLNQYEIRKLGIKTTLTKLFAF